MQWNTNKLFKRNNLEKRNKCKYVFIIMVIIIMFFFLTIFNINNFFYISYTDN